MADGLWDRVTEFENLCRAARRASLGKRNRPSAARFLERLEVQVLALRAELRDHTYRPGPLVRFEIHDPKRRTISAAPFRDRVVHHALVAPLEPLFEAAMVPQSFACRRGKGTHAALDLRLKPRSLQLAPCRDGLPFFGWRLYPRTRRLRPENLRRIRKRLARTRQRIARGTPELDCAAATRAVVEHLRAGRSRLPVRG